MENKYYQPSIEEFHVGFEYERSMSKFEEIEWIKLTMSVNFLSLDDIDDEIIKEEIRVKYLDQSDIESLGFTNIKDRGMSENYGDFFIKKDPIFQLANYELRYWYINNRLRVNRINGTIFDGTIKNLSELKVVLKQIGVE
jgi:hypothetical protein